MCNIKKHVLFCDGISWGGGVLSKVSKKCKNQRNWRRWNLIYGIRGFGGGFLEGG